MFEWDRDCALRKFKSTIAKVQVETSAPSWKIIYEITSDGVVYIYDVFTKKKDAIGETLFEARKHKPQTNLPVVSFLYEPIVCGSYYDLINPDMFWTVRRNHYKSWAIGLETRGFDINWWNKVTGNNGDTGLIYNITIDLDKRVETEKLGGKTWLLPNDFLIRGSSLFLKGVRIGLVKDDILLLNNEKLVDYVQRTVGKSWQVKPLAV